MTNRPMSIMRYAPGFFRNQNVRRRSATAAAICIALATGSAWADDSESWGEAKIEEFDEFTVFIEICGTDEDAGIKGLLGGEPWRRATVSGPDGRLIYRFGPKLGDVGSGTVFWESAEPSFVNLPLDEFLDRFPEGEYTAGGTKLGGGRLTRHGGADAQSPGRSRHHLTRRQGSRRAHGRESRCHVGGSDGGLPRRAAPLGNRRLHHDRHVRNRDSR